MIRLIAVLLCAAVAGPSNAMDDKDLFLWLEEIDSERSLDWAREQNERSEDLLRSHSDFEAIHQRNLDILTADDRIAFPSLMGGEVYNFWRDANHVRGIWRRTELEAYRGGTPDWDVILDIDRLAEEEDRNWIWAGSGCRYPDYDRCLIGLSIGGADASYRREFDLVERRFVDDGFNLPESKSRVAWRDRDSVFFGPAFEDEQMTDSGYPRQVRIWRRGTAHAESELVYEGERGDVAVSGIRIWDRDDYFDLIVRVPDFFSRHYYFYREGESHRLKVPTDANISAILDGQAVIELRSDWQLGEQHFRQGSLLAGPVETLLDDLPQLEVLYAPGERSSVVSVRSTHGALVVGLIDNVISRLVRFTHDDEGWHMSPLAAPEMGTIGIISTDDRSDRFFYTFTGFLTPTSLYEADALADSHTLLRSEPARFDAEGMSVEQHEAVSADGERIPYFLVTPRGFEANGRNPTLIGAYGGFEVARRPGYSALIGSAWLERGGVYVLANIRGGGEFGPRWHQAALRENRQRAFDDLIAVAENLIEREITSPDHLGIRGGSNGGLLTGAVMVQRPDLFGAVISQVPLLDMRRYHLLLAGASWMAEYGNPDDPDDWAFISRYSPYQNLDPEADYPTAFVTTSTRDDRVHPGHARKFVARMLEQGHDVLYFENIEGGHGGAANLKQSAYIEALIYSYLHLKLKDGEKSLLPDD